jgi:alkylated DNA repair dioxygenase AlkB
MKSLLIVLGLVAAITGGIVFFVIRDSNAASRRQTAEAEAIGFVATPTSWWNGDENEEGHTLTFAFVDGQNNVHSKKLQEISWYDSTRKYKVCYNPTDPKDHKLYPADHECGS